MQVLFIMKWREKDTKRKMRTYQVRQQVGNDEEDSIDVDPLSLGQCSAMSPVHDINSE